MAKKTDKIIKQYDGYANVSAKAKKGTAFFKQYEDVDTLLNKETKQHVVDMYNAMTRVRAINDVNREPVTPFPVRELGRVAKAADTETQAEITKAVEAIIAKAKAKAKAEKAA